MLKEAINALYYTVSLQDLRDFNQTLPWSLSYSSLVYLDIIYCTPQCTPSHLSRILERSKSTVTMKLNELVRQGFVVRRRSQSDKRVVYLELAPPVQELYARYEARVDRVVEHLKTRFSQEDLDRFQEMLLCLKDCYEEESRHER